MKIKFVILLVILFLVSFSCTEKNPQGQTSPMPPIKKVVLTDVGIRFLPPADWAPMSSQDFDAKIVAPLKASVGKSGSIVTNPIQAYVNGSNTCVISRITWADSTLSDDKDQADALMKKYVDQFQKKGKVDTDTYMQNKISIRHMRLIGDQFVVMKVIAVPPTGGVFQWDYFVMKDSYEKELPKLQASIQSLEATVF